VGQDRDNRKPADTGMRTVVLVVILVVFFFILKSKKKADSDE
jgi:preprotein translocase subunit YajC